MHAAVSGGGKGRGRNVLANDPNQHVAEVSPLKLLSMAFSIVIDFILFRFESAFLTTHGHSKSSSMDNVMVLFTMSESRVRWYLL